MPKWAKYSCQTQQTHLMFNFSANHLFLLSRTEREGCLSIDPDASLNTDHEPRRLKIPRGSALVCLDVEFGTPPGAHGRQKRRKCCSFKPALTSIPGAHLQGQQ